MIEWPPSSSGGVTNGRVAFVYGACDEHVLWHEALHTLGAEDCYDVEDQGPTCERDNCIMQYAPTKCNVGEWPFLCGDNVKRIRENARESAPRK